MADIVCVSAWEAIKVDVEGQWGVTARIARAARPTARTPPVHSPTSQVSFLIIAQ